MCYQPLDVSDGDSVARLVRMLDKANGHPAGVHAPAALVEDATDLFLLHNGGRPMPWDPESDDAKLDDRVRAFADADEAARAAPPRDRTYRTHAPRAPAGSGGGEEDGAFSWYS